jgi:predicted N-formylglutamate amidohydrolase
MKGNLPHAFPGRRAPMTAAAASQARRLETRRILWRLAFMSDFQPVERIEGPADAGVLIVCDHASHALPAEYGSLGLPPEAFQRHIAYDIGAAGVTRRLAKLLNAPALLSCFSRLLIDPNRGADDPTLVMRISDGALIPGNARIDAAEIGKRRDRYWRPYREAAIAEVERLSASGRIPSVISIHSFTPIWKGAAATGSIASGAMFPTARRQ